MGTNGVNASAALESITSTGAGVLELWDGVSPVVWHHDGSGPLGRSDEDITLNDAPATAGVVLRCARQKGGASPRRGCDAVLCAVGVLDREPLAAGRTPSRGWRMDATTLSDRFTVLCISVLYRGCAIPVEWRADARWRERLMGALLEDLVQLSERQRAQRVDRDCAGRPWVVCALALPPHCDAGLASVLAHQSGRQGASGRGGEI